MPKEINYLNQKTTSFSDKKEIEKYINDRIKEISASETSNWLKENHDYRAFFFEIPLFTSFPPFHISLIKNLDTFECLYSISTKHKTVQRIQDTNIEVAYLEIIIFIINNDSFFKSKNYIEKIYDYCIGLANDIIKAYKLIPGRHNHDLDTLHTAKSIPLLPVYEIVIKPDTKIIKKNYLLLNTGFISLIKNMTPLNESENLHLMSNILRDSSLTFDESIFRITKAYDFNCQGEPNIAITLATSAVEGLFIQIETLVRHNELGEPYDQVLINTSKKSFYHLKKFLHENIGLDFENDQLAKEWDNKCYELRNKFLHRQGDFDSIKSRNALDVTSIFMIHVLKKLIEQYPKSADVAYLAIEILDSLLKKDI